MLCHIVFNDLKLFKMYLIIPGVKDLTHPFRKGSIQLVQQMK